MATNRNVEGKEELPMDFFFILCPVVNNVWSAIGSQSFHFVGVRLRCYSTSLMQKAAGESLFVVRYCLIWAVKSDWDKTFPSVWALYSILPCQRGLTSCCGHEFINGLPIFCPRWSALSVRYLVLQQSWKGAVLLLCHTRLMLWDYVLSETAMSIFYESAK